MKLRQKLGIFVAALTVALSVGAVAATPAQAAYTYWKIKLYGYDRCLDVRGVSYDDGALIQTYSCIAGQPNQRWMLWPIPGYTNRYWIQARYDAKCLDVLGVSPFWGANIQQYRCQEPPTLNQVWIKNVMLVSGSNQVIAWQSANSPWCLAAQTWNNGSDVRQEDCPSTLRNWWEMIPD